MAQRLKRLPPMRETRVWSLDQEDPLEKEMAIHSSILAWRIPWTEKPSRLQSMGSQRVRHDWATSPHLTSQVVLVVKNLPVNAADVRVVDLIPELGRSPGEGHDNPLQYSCLKNSMDRGGWWAAVHGITNSWTCLKWLSMHALLIYETHTQKWKWRKVAL